MRHVTLLTLLCAGAIPAFSQSSSTVTGQVRDQAQAVVPNAKVVVKAVATGFEYRTITSHEGNYTVPSLPPVDYQVMAEAPGFKTAVSPVFKVDTTATARVDLTLLPADSKQVIEVTAAPPAIETESSMTGSTVSQKEIDSLPLQGRNSLELALTVPGVAGDIGADEGGIFQTVPAAGSNLSVTGGRPSSIAFLADGSNATSLAIGRATVTFSPDVIQEFKVITSTFSAQYGVTGGGIISTVSKSGTNEFHGSAFWFQRNPSLAARQFGAILAPKLRRNETGFTFGGPVRVPKIYNGKNKTFFFFSIEPKRWQDGTEARVRVPTAAERTGDFRNYWVAAGQNIPLLYRQVECGPSEADCQQLKPLNRANNTTVYPMFCDNCPPDQVGHVIPKAYLDPLSQKLLQNVPLPNMAPDVNGANYLGVRGVTGSDNRWNLKFDHVVSSSDRLTLRYTNIPNQSDRYLLVRGNYQLQSYPGDNSNTRQVYLSETHTISPRIINEFRGNYTFSDYSSTPPGDFGTHNYTKEMGLPNVTDWGYPRFNLDNYLSPALGMGNNQLLGKYIENQYQFADDLSMTLGKHTVTLGFDWRIMQMNVKAGSLGDASGGLYDFRSSLTQSGNANIPTGSGGISLANFLIGVPGSATLRAIVIPYYYRWKAGAAFVQDDFKVSSNLTLNLGMRWQYNSPRAEKYDRQASIDLNNPVPLKDAQGRTNGYTLNYVYSGFSGSRYLEPAYKKNFEPRFGFAWTPGFGWNKNKMTVVRGGYGISHLGSASARTREPLPDFGVGSGGSWSYVQWTGTGAQPSTQSKNPQYLISIGRNAPVVVANPLVLQMPSDGRVCAGCSPADPRVPSGDLVAFANSNKPPYIQTWNLTAQTKLPDSMVLSLSYLGQKGTHLYSPGYNINNPDVVQFENLLDQGGDPAQLVPDPFGRVDSNGNVRNVALQDLMRPYPTLGNISVTGMTSTDSIYHAGTAGIERRFSAGIGFRLNYTWGKSIDTSSLSRMVGGQVSDWDKMRVQTPNNLRQERSVSMFDSRHRFNLTMNAELPFGKRHRLSAGRIGNLFLSGWSVNAVGSLYSGLPVSPYLGDANGIPGGATRPNVVRPDIVSGVPILNPLWSKNSANDVPYYNPAAFARPAFGQTGNAPRTLDYARDPWKPGLNMSLFREIHPFENQRRYLQLRGEFFNVLNHTTFGNPSSMALFSGSVPVSRTGLSLAGPIPYLVGKKGTDFPAGSRESILAQYHDDGFGKFIVSRNGGGRIVQLALKIYF